MVFRGNAEMWKTSYVFLSMSFVGSFLALIFFRFIYQKTTEAMDEMEQEEDEADNHEALLDH